MRYSDLFESSILPPYLYHGTQRRNVSNIMKTGLKAEKTKSGGYGVYLTDDLFTAKNYATMHGDDPVVLVIDITYIRIDKLLPDDYELVDFIDEPWSDVLGDEYYDDYSDVPWELSMKAVNQVLYGGDIPPSAISVHE